MDDVLIVLVLLAIIGGAIAYVIKAKKSGKKCIGCPDGCSCGDTKGSPVCPCCEKQSEKTEN